MNASHDSSRLKKRDGDVMETGCENTDGSDGMADDLSKDENLFIHNIFSAERKARKRVRTIEHLSFAMRIPYPEINQTKQKGAL